MIVPSIKSDGENRFGTPLSCAILGRKHECVKLLLEANADPGFSQKDIALYNALLRVCYGLTVPFSSITLSLTRTSACVLV